MGKELEKERAGKIFGRVLSNFFVEREVPPQTPPITAPADFFVGGEVPPQTPAQSQRPQTHTPNRHTDTLNSNYTHPRIY